VLGISLLADVSLPWWTAGIVLLTWFGSMWLAVRAIAALRARKTVSQDEIRRIQGLIAQTNALVETTNQSVGNTRTWLEIADAVNGFKAAVWGVLGVFIGAVGGLSADWVAHGTIESGEWGRIAIVGGLLIAVTVVAVLLILGADGILAWVKGKLPQRDDPIAAEMEGEDGDQE
jgi:hypothetical protein